MNELDMKDVQYVPCFSRVFLKRSSDDCFGKKDIMNMIFTPRLKE